MGVFLRPLLLRMSVSIHVHAWWVWVIFGVFLAAVIGNAK